MTLPARVPLCALNDCRHTLPAPDAQTYQRIASSAALQLTCCSQRQPRARGAERMSHGDRATVRVNAVVIEGNLKPLEAREYLSGESLVDLNDIHVLDAEPCP